MCVCVRVCYISSYLSPSNSLHLTCQLLCGGFVAARGQGGQARELFEDPLGARLGGRKKMRWFGGRKKKRWKYSQMTLGDDLPRLRNHWKYMEMPSGNGTWRAGKYIIYR